MNIIIPKPNKYKNMEVGAKKPTIFLGAKNHALKCFRNGTKMKHRGETWSPFFLLNFHGTLQNWELPISRIPSVEWEFQAACNRFDGIPPGFFEKSMMLWKGPWPPMNSSRVPHTSPRPGDVKTSPSHGPLTTSQGVINREIHITTSVGHKPRQPALKTPRGVTTCIKHRVAVFLMSLIDDSCEPLLPCKSTEGAAFRCYIYWNGACTKLGGQVRRRRKSSTFGKHQGENTEKM